MMVPYPMLRFGHFTKTVSCSNVVYGRGLRSEGQNFTQNLRFFVT